MPVACWTIASPQPIRTTRRIHGTSRITENGVDFVLSTCAVCSTIRAYSLSASAAGRLRSSTARASAIRPWRPYQRGESGSTSMPSSSATAGTAATASMVRQTCGSWMRWSSRALVAKASIWPVTIISSLMVTIRPRRSAGAISAR